MLLAFGKAAPPPTSIVFVLMHGTLFGQTALAAGWCAVGPFSLARRLTLSSVWSAAIIIAFGSNRWMEAELPDIHRLMSFSLVVGTELVLVGLPLWGIAAWFGVKLVSRDGKRMAAYYERQIGVREAMVLTGVVASVLGAARWSTGGLNDLSINKEALAVYSILTIAASVMAVLLMTHMIFAKNWMRSIVGAVIYIFVAMLGELLALPFVWPFGIDPDSYWAIAFIDLTQGAWLIGVIVLLQAAGFQAKSNDNRPADLALPAKSV